MFFHRLSLIIKGNVALDTNGFGIGEVAEPKAKLKNKS